MVALAVKRKTSKSWNVTFKENGVAQNITGWTVYFTVKKATSQSDANALIAKTITSHTDPTHGITKISLTPSDTDINVGNYIYDIVFIDTSTNRRGTENDDFVITDYVKN